MILWNNLKCFSDASEYDFEDSEVAKAFDDSEDSDDSKVTPKNLWGKGTQELWGLRSLCGLWGSKGTRGFREHQGDSEDPKDSDTECIEIYGLKMSKVLLN